MRKQKILGYYNYTVLLTYIGMLTGFVGILSALERNTFLALVCLMIAGLCDMFDGAVASTRDRTAQEKTFGIQIDSLSDLICFGVLPGTLVSAMSGNRIAVRCVSALYVLCALIRLAYFNVDEQERQKTSSSSREIYYGMPVTLSAVLIPTIYGMSRLGVGKAEILLPMALLIMAILFLLPVPLKKPKMAGKIGLLVWGVAALALVVFVCRSV